MNTMPRLLQVVEALAAASAWSLIRRLTQTPLHRRHKFTLAQSRLAAR
jgi:hypothetical protein